MIDLHQGKKWLVKSNGKLLGPYTSDQIEELLRKKQISLIDEIRDMETRWLYLRENKAFAKTIELVRKEIESKAEVTQTLQTTTKQTSSITQQTEKSNVNVNLNQTRTDRITDFTTTKSFTDVVLPEKEAVLENVIDDVEMPSSFDKPDPDTRITPKVKNFVFENDHRIVQAKKKTNKKIWINFALILIAICGAGIGYFFYQKTMLAKSDLKSIALFKKYKLQELDDKAIQTYLKLNPELQNKVLPDLIEYLPKLEELGNADVKSIKEKIQDLQLNIDQKSKLFLVQYLTYLNQNNLPKAEEELLKAKSILPSSNLVKENEAIFFMKKHLYSESIKTFLAVYEKEKAGRYLLGAFQVFNYLTDEEKSQFEQSLRSSIDRHLAIFYDFRKELSIAQFYFALKEHNTVLVQMAKDEFLKTPGQLFQKFKHPTLIPNNSYSWTDLQPYLDQILSSLNSEESPMFHLHLAIESYQLASLNDWLERVNNVTQDPSVKQQANLVTYFYQGRFKEVLSIEKTRQLDKKSSLNHLLLGLAKLNLDPNANISEHLNYLTELNEKFYHNWLKIEQLAKTKSTAQIRSFLLDHFLTQPSFIPALEAKGLLE